MNKPKFKIGSHVCWYNNIIIKQEILSDIYIVIGMVFIGDEWLYTIKGRSWNGKIEQTHIFESGLYHTREDKLKRILYE